LFKIIDVTDISDINTWVKENFVHEYLKFTVIYDFTTVNFLDLSITLSSYNVIQTELYKNAVSKHKFLHYNLAHPRHLLNSLPYSSGLRIIRSCSIFETRERELSSLMDRFRKWNYPDSTLLTCLNKLSTLSQDFLLRPRKPLLSTYQHNVLVNYYEINL